MSNYSSLKTAIQQAVYTNGNNEITGAGLQAVLLQIVNTVGDGYVFKGVATTGTSAGTPDANVFYIASAGTYDNFGGEYVVHDGCIGLFAYDGSWSKQEIHIFSINDFIGSDGTITDMAKSIMAGATSAPYIIQDHILNVTSGGDYVYAVNSAWDIVCFMVKRDSDWAVVSGVGTGGSQLCMFLDPDLGLNTTAKLANQFAITKQSMSTFGARVKAIKDGGYQKDILVCIDIPKANNVSLGGLSMMQGKYDSRYFCVPDLLLYGNTGSPLLGYVAGYSITPFIKITGDPIAAINIWSSANTSSTGGAGIHFYNSSYAYCGTIDLSAYSHTGSTGQRAIVIETEDIPLGAEYVRFSCNNNSITNNICALGGGVESFDSLGITHYSSEHFFDKSSEERIGVLPFIRSFATLRLSDLYELNGRQLILAGVYIGETASPTINSVQAKVAFYGADRRYLSALNYTDSGLFLATSTRIMTVAVSPSDIPSGAKYAAFFSTASSLDSPVIVSGLKNLCDPAYNYPDIAQNYDKIVRGYVTEDLLPYETVSGFMRIDGLKPLASFSVKKYNVTPNGEYLFSAYLKDSSYTFNPLFFMNGSDNIVGLLAMASGPQTIEDRLVVIPEGATQVWQNVANAYASAFYMKRVTEVLKVDKLQEAMGSGTEKLMKVVVMNDDTFYIRTRYNASKDIIVTHYINGNGLLSFGVTYIGGNSLSDEEIMITGNIVSSHFDSTAPIRGYTQYWHLFAQHGYPIPYFNNSVGMTASDIGARWDDQLGREYTIGNVTDEYIYLLPVIYQDADGHYTRDWHSTATSEAITSLTHVSGGIYASQIAVTGLAQRQLQPIMSHTNRTFTADGNIIQGAGTYICNEFCASESQKGYDPATVSDWFGGNGGTPDLSNASVMAEFTFSYKYKGAQCALNTTMNLLREAKGTYSGIQQQFFFDNGGYKAMFMIPKAAAQNGIELDKPFNSPTSAGADIVVFRNAEQLKDVNDPIDRQIGFLYNQGTGEYLVGMAAGLSLVSGDTTTAKRNSDIPVGGRLLNFSPANTNKFYVYATNSATFESGYFPAGYFKEINCYVCYFDPAENEGQVYWYKDGSVYVIYAHCQSEEHNLAVSVPPFMEGLSLSVVEKTADASLLTDSIHNGKLFVDYAAAGANYIVLTAK